MLKQNYSWPCEEHSSMNLKWKVNEWNSYSGVGSKQPKLDTTNEKSAFPFLVKIIHFTALQYHEIGSNYWSLTSFSFHLRRLFSFYHFRLLISKWNIDTYQKSNYRYYLNARYYIYIDILVYSPTTAWFAFCIRLYFSFQFEFTKEKVKLVTNDLIWFLLYFIVLQNYAISSCNSLKCSIPCFMFIFGNQWSVNLTQFINFIIIYEFLVESEAAEQVRFFPLAQSQWLISLVMENTTKKYNHFESLQLLKGEFECP